MRFIILFLLALTQVGLSFFAKDAIAFQTAIISMNIFIAAILIKNKEDL